jgi:hypothetical protein
LIWQPRRRGVKKVLISNHARASHDGQLWHWNGRYLFHFSTAFLDPFTTWVCGMDIEQSSLGGNILTDDEYKSGTMFLWCYSYIPDNRLMNELRSKMSLSWSITELWRNMKDRDLGDEYISKKESEHLTTMMFATPVVSLDLPVLRPQCATAARNVSADLASVINISDDEGVPLNQSKLKDKSDGILLTGERSVVTL